MSTIFERFSQEEAKTPKGITIFDQLAEKEENKKKGASKEEIEETLTDFGQQTGRKFLSNALASPKLFAELLSSGSKYLAEKGAEGKGEIDPFTQNVLKVMGFPEAVLKRIGYPDSDQFEEMIMNLGEKTGAKQLSKEPQTGIGRRGAKIGEFAGTAALGGPKNFAERLLFGALGGEGAAEVEELGGGPGSQIGAAIALPTAVQLVSSIWKGKFKPNSEELEQLATFFRENLGMTEEEIVPLLQPSGKQKALGKIAKSDDKVEGIIGKKGSVESKLGEGYEALKREARTSSSPPLSDIQKLEAENTLRNANRFGVPINEDGTITLYHGTRSGNQIRRSEELKNFPFFTTSKAEAKNYAEAAQAKGNPEVFEVKLQPHEISLGAGGPDSHYATSKKATVPLKKSMTPQVSSQQIEKLIGEFEYIGDSLRKSVMPSDEKISALKKIDKAVEELWQNGITPEGIIETTIDINDAVNWNSYKQGKKDLAKLKRPLKELYKEIAPEGAATFEKLNEGWSRLKNIQKNIGENNFKSLVNYGKGIAYLGSAVKDVVAGDVKGLIATGTTALGVEMSQWLAKKMLTDPKYQNILLKSATAIKKGSKAQVLKAYDELVSETLKDNPEEAKKVDWESLKNKPSK